MENKTSGSITLGIERMKYLDLANMSFSNGEYDLTEGAINSFLETIKDGSDAAKMITIEFDKIELNKKADTHRLNEHLKTLRTLERTDVKNKGNQEIRIEYLHDKKTVCWTVAMKHGLFYE